MTPYSETLIDLVTTALEGIDQTSGYSFTTYDVQRYDREDLTTASKPCIHVFRTAERKQRSGSAWSVTVELLILVYLFEHETESLPTEIYESDAGADVEHALCQLEDDPSFRATWEEFESTLFTVSEGDETVEVGVAVGATLGYRVDFKDPRTPIDPE
jgi:hypothetical protein